jgi:hypothetical protein
MQVFHYGALQLMAGKCSSGAQHLGGTACVVLSGQRVTTCILCCLPHWRHKNSMTTFLVLQQ